MDAGRVINELDARQQKDRRGAQHYALILSMIDLRRSMNQALEAQLASAYPDTKRMVVCQGTTLVGASAGQVPLME